MAGGWLTAALLIGGAPYWLLRTSAMLVRMRRKQFYLPPDADPAAPTSGPLVSVMVPARNEAHQIADCLEALAAQDYQDLEFIVVDDNSEDDTSGAARAVDMGGRPIQVIRNEVPLPDDWRGKNRALWIAQQHAKGEYLVFVDADVWLHPRAITLAIEQLRRDQVGMISYWGMLATGSFWEHLVQPYVSDFILLFNRLTEINDPARLDRYLANGQFLAFERRVYDAVGGHTVVRESVIEDVQFARHIKQAGYGVRTWLALELMRVRMYRSFHEIWQGWTRSFYPGMRGNPVAVGVATVYIFLSSVLCWLVLAWKLVALGLGQPFGVHGALAAAGVGMTLLFRWMTRKLFDAPAWTFPLHPLGAAVTAAVILNSAVARKRFWKGREVV